MWKKKQKEEVLYIELVKAPKKTEPIIFVLSAAGMVVMILGLAISIALILLP